MPCWVLGLDKLKTIQNIDTVQEFESGQDRRLAGEAALDDVEDYHC